MGAPRHERGGGPSAAGAAGLPPHRVQRGGVHHHRSPDLAPTDRHAAVEHRPTDRGGHGAVRHHRDPHRLVRRVHRPPRASDLGGAGRGALRHPRLRRQFRVGVHQHMGRRVSGRGPGHDPRRLSAGLSSGGGQLPQRRPEHGGGRPQPGARSDPYLPTGGHRAGPHRHPRGLCSGRPGHSGRVRRLRDPRLPDLHHRDLHRVQHLRRPHRLRPRPRAGRPQHPRPGWRRPGPGTRPVGPGRSVRPAGSASTPSGPGHRAGLDRIRRSGRSGPRGAHRVQRLLDVRGRSPLAHRCVTAQRRLAHRRLRRRRRHPGHLALAAGGPPGRPAPFAGGPDARAQHLPGAGLAGRGHRLRPQLLHGALPGGIRLSAGPAAHHRLRHPLLPAGSGRASGPRWPTPRSVWKKRPGPWGRAGWLSSSGSPSRWSVPDWPPRSAWSSWPP